MLPTTPAHWRLLLPHLQWWHALTLPQRQCALALGHGWQPLPHPFRNLSPDLLATLFEIGSETDPQARTRPAEPLRALIAFNLDLAAWTNPKGVVDIPRFVQAASSHAQRHNMTGIRIGSNPALAAGAYAKRMTAGAFGRALMESKTAQEFIRAAGGWVPDGATLGPAQHKALQTWLAGATAKGNATRLFDRSAFAVDDSIRPEAILHLALGYGLIILQRTHDTLLPAFTVIAPGRPADQKPGNVERAPLPPAEPFARPFLLDDMETWLRALKAAPAPVLADGWSVPLQHQRRVARDFPVLPDHLPGDGFARDARSAAALYMLFRLDLVSVSGAKAKDFRLEPAASAEEWLAKAKRDRLAAVLAWFPLGARSKAKPKDRLAFLGPFDPEPLPPQAATATVGEWLEAAFAGLKGPTAWKPFLKSAAEKANPFVADAERDATLAGRWASWPEPPEEGYRVLLLRQAARLASVGALAFAPGPKGSLSVTLAPVGRWLSGQAQAWELPGPAPVAVVGADFTVTLLVPDGDARIELGAFCEAEGAGMRLTRKSVQAAAHRGLDAARILSALQGFARHALPANVVHEVREWAGGRRTVRLGEAILIEGDDPVTLIEIRAAFPGEFEPVSATAIRYAGKGKRSDLARRLAKKGFFPA